MSFRYTSTYPEHEWWCPQCIFIKALQAGTAWIIYDYHLGRPGIWTVPAGVCLCKDGARWSWDEAALMNGNYNNWKDFELVFANGMQPPRLPTVAEIRENDGDLGSLIIRIYGPPEFHARMTKSLGKEEETL